MSSHGHRSPRSWELAQDGGFTIVEVLVAATLLVIGALATLALLDNGASATAVSRQRDVANALAQEMVERSTGGRYTPSRNDLTDVDPGAAARIAGPADRLRVTLDPDGTAASTAVAPATVASGSPAVDVPQSWTLTRQNTRYTVSYRSCTTSDTFQGVQILGPYDCSLGTNGTPPTPPTPADPSICTIGAIPPSYVDPANPGMLTVRLAVLGFTGLNVCVGAVSSALADGLCTLLGQSSLLSGLTNNLLGTNGLLTNLLGGLLKTGATAGLCPTSQVEGALTGAKGGIATSTRIAVQVSWTDYGGHARTIQQSSTVRRPSA